MDCQKCHVQVGADAAFCSTCGAPLGLPGVADKNHEDARRTGSMTPSPPRRQATWSRLLRLVVILSFTAVALWVGTLYVRANTCATRSRSVLASIDTILAHLNDTVERGGRYGDMIDEVKKAGDDLRAVERTQAAGGQCSAEVAASIHETIAHGTSRTQALTLYLSSDLDAQATNDQLTEARESGALGVLGGYGQSLYRKRQAEAKAAQARAATELARAAVEAEAISSARRNADAAINALESPLRRVWSDVQLSVLAGQEGLRGSSIDRESALALLHEGYKPGAGTWTPPEHERARLQKEFRSKAVTFRVSVEVARPFRQGQRERVWVITKMTPIEDGDPTYDCHACAPGIGGITFSRIIGGWRKDRAATLVLRAGGSGELPGTSVIAVGPDRYGLRLDAVDGGQGYYELHTAILAEAAAGIEEILSFETGQDNRGACGGADLPPCWGYGSDLRFEAVGQNEYFDLVSTTRGTRRSDSGEVETIDESKRYIVSEGKYRRKE